MIDYQFFFIIIVSLIIIVNVLCSVQISCHFAFCTSSESVFLIFFTSGPRGGVRGGRGSRGRGGGRGKLLNNISDFSTWT